MKELTPEERAEYREANLSIQEFVPRSYLAIEALRRTKKPHNPIGQLLRRLINTSAMRVFTVDPTPLMDYREGDLRIIGKPFRSFVVLNYNTEKRTPPLSFNDAMKAFRKAKYDNVQSAN